jgi:hypothetical protein
VLVGLAGGFCVRDCRRSERLISAACCTACAHACAGQQQQGPVDVTAPKATANSSSSSSSSSSSPSGGSKAKRQKQGSARAAAPVIQQPAQIDTSALQNLVGGETVFYGEYASTNA